MNWNDYEAAWKRQPMPVGKDAEISDLLATFETKRRKMSAALLFRDWTEVAACGIVVVSYLMYWRHIGRAGWPMAAAIVLVLGVAALFVRERLRARRQRLPAGAPLLARVEADIAELKYQCYLVRTLWLWYLGPCGLAMAVHGWVILDRAPMGSPLHEPRYIVGAIVCVAGLLWLVWWFNRRALRLRLEPRLAELEKLRQELLDRNGGEANAAILVRR